MPLTYSQSSVAPGAEAESLGTRCFHRQPGGTSCRCRTTVRCVPTFLPPQRAWPLTAFYLSWR